MSTTGALDFRGTTKNPQGGTVQDKNFIVQLGEFAMAKAEELGKDPRQAIVEALTALRLGNVIAQIYLLQASNPENGNVWTVPAFRPIHVEFDAPQAAIGAGDDTASPDEIPF
jgi:hypothetical protein